MADAIRIRAKITDGVAEAHVLMPHPMETGFRHDDDGRLIDAHYITDVHIEVAGRTVLTAWMGIGVSADPLLSFRFRGARPGERITVSWTDNKGDVQSGEGTVT